VERHHLVEGHSILVQPCPHRHPGPIVTPAQAGAQPQTTTSRSGIRFKPAPTRSGQSASSWRGRFASLNWAASPASAGRWYSARQSCCWRERG
jgi:hypothetical protein